MSINTQRMLLLDCDCAIEEMMRLCLETIPNCKVIVVNSGVEAIDKAATEKIDAILLDIDRRMPDLSWSEIIKDLKQNPVTYSIPLILLNSTPQSQTLQELQQTGAIKAISKSFDLLILANQISTLLDWN